MNVHSSWYFFFCMMLLFSACKKESDIHQKDDKNRNLSSSGKLTDTDVIQPDNETISMKHILLEAGAIDEQRKIVAGELWIDGKKIGVVPGTYEIKKKNSSVEIRTKYGNYKKELEIEKEVADKIYLIPQITSQGIIGDVFIEFVRFRKKM